MSSDLADFRARVRTWCAEHVPPNWRERQTGVGEAEFVAFQKQWFAELHRAGYAVPHWPAEWGGGMSVPEQVVLYQELAAADAPRLVLAFVGIHHAASTLLVAGTDEQRKRHLPAIRRGDERMREVRRPSSTARSGCRVFPNPRPDPIWPRCAPRHDGRATSSW